MIFSINVGRAFLVFTTAVTLSCSVAQKSGGEDLESVHGFSRLDIYSPFELKTNLDHLSQKQRKMIGFLIDASEIMDDLFWKQAFGEDKDRFLARISDQKLRTFAELNYGPWDRLDGDKPYLEGYGPKPAGAQFYPENMSKEEFEKANLKDGKDLYTLIRRGESGSLESLPYNRAYAKELQRASFLLLKASELADHKGFKKYLRSRAMALVTNQYRASDFEWMEMKGNPIELVIGPIESYEDGLFGYKTAFEAYVLIKDMEWSKRLAKYAQFLPELQRKLPVAEKYKKEKPGGGADLNAYDVVFYAGHSNAGAKTIAINLPNDEEVQLKKGTRRLQLKNIMRAKFEKILMPLARKLIAPEQLKHVTFDAFFANTMFHEVAHGLGIKNTINGRGLVRQSLKDHAGSLEECKADTLGMHMISQLKKKGEVNGTMKEYHVTALAGIFRSIRFGASSAHGNANLLRFQFFKKMGGFTRDQEGYYRVNFDRMDKAVEELARLILTIQGDGDYNKLNQVLSDASQMDESLVKDLESLNSSDIPVDIEVLQGKDVLGL